MKYYIIKHAINKDTGNVFPQSQEQVNNTPPIYTDKNFTKKGIIMQPEIMPELKLENNAKPSTLLSAATLSDRRTLVIKKEFAEFLCNYDVPECLVYDIKVHHKNTIYDNYYILQMIDSYDYLDYQKSKFFYGNFSDLAKSDLQPDNTRNYTSIDNCEDGEDKRDKSSKQNKYLILEKGIIDFSHTEKDMFYMHTFSLGNGFYVSEKLKEAIESNGFTGIEFIENDNNKRLEIIYN